MPKTTFRPAIIAIRTRRLSRRALGVSYDVYGDRDTILFAGAGRYYDRNNFYTASLERLFNEGRSDVTVQFCDIPGERPCPLPERFRSTRCVGTTPIAIRKPSAKRLLQQVFAATSGR